MPPPPTHHRAPTHPRRAEGLLIDDHGLIAELDPESYLRRREERIAQTVTGAFDALPWNVQSLMIGAKQVEEPDDIDAFGNQQLQQQQGPQTARSGAFGRTSSGTGTTMLSSGAFAQTYSGAPPQSSGGGGGRLERRKSMSRTPKVVALTGVPDDFDFALDGEAAPMPLRRRQSMLRREDSVSGGGGFVGTDAIFREAPAGVATKIAAFVARYTPPTASDEKASGSPTTHVQSQPKPDTNWQTVSELLDAFKKAEKHAADITAVVKELSVSAANGIPGQIFKTPVKRRAKDSHESMIKTWEDDVNVAVALMDNLFGLLVAFAPGLTNACAAVRKTLCGAIFSDGAAYADAFQMTNAAKAVTEVSRQALSRRVNVFMLHAFGVDQARVEHSRLLALLDEELSQSSLPVSPSVAGGGSLSGSTSATVQSQQHAPLRIGNILGALDRTAAVGALLDHRRLKKRAMLSTHLLQANLVEWRNFAMRAVLRAWRRERHLSREEMSRSTELTRLRGEVELLSRLLSEANAAQRRMSLTSSTDTDPNASVNVELQRELSLQHREFLEEGNRLRMQNERLLAQVKMLQDDGRTQESQLKTQLAAAWDSLRRLESEAESTAKELHRMGESSRRAELAERDLASTCAELNVIVATVLDSLTDGIGAESEALAAFVQTTQQRGGVAALASWLTTMSQRTLEKTEVREWLSQAVSDVRVTGLNADALLHFNGGGSRSGHPLGEDENSAAADAEARGPQLTRSSSSSAAAAELDDNNADVDSLNATANSVAGAGFDATVGSSFAMTTDGLDVTRVLAGGAGRGDDNREGSQPLALASGTRDPAPPTLIAPLVAAAQQRGGGASTLRVIDFCEGPLLLDAYASAMHSVEDTCVVLDDVLRVFSETDSTAKAAIVIDLADRLLTSGRYVAHCGGSLRRPSDYTTSEDLASRESPAARSLHAAFTTQLVLYWIARMASIDAPRFVSSAKVGTVARTPQEWLRELRSASQRFESWRYGLAALVQGAVGVAVPANSQELPVFSPLSPVRAQRLGGFGSAGSGGGGGGAPHTVADVSPDGKVRRAEERMLFHHSWTRALIFDLLRQIDGGKRADVATDEHRAAVEEIVQVARGASHLLASVFRFYATLSVDAFPILILGPTETFKMVADMGLGGTFSREEVREIFQMVNGSRKRIADAVIAALPKEAGVASSGQSGGGGSVGGGATAPALAGDAARRDVEARAQRQFQLSLEEFIPLLLRLVAHIAARRGTALTTRELPLEFSMFVSQQLGNAALLDTEFVQELTQSAGVKRVIDANRKMLQAVFALCCATDARLEPRAVIAQPQFAQLITDMGCLDDAGVSFVSVSGVFIHSLQVGHNKPMLMCFSEFIVAIVAVSIMKFPSPFVQAPIKLSRFVAQYVHPFYRKRCVAHNAATGANSRGPAAKGFSGGAGASLTTTAGMSLTVDSSPRNALSAPGALSGITSIGNDGGQLASYASVASTQAPTEVPSLLLPSDSRGAAAAPVKRRVPTKPTTQQPQSSPSGVGSSGVTSGRKASNSRLGSRRSSSKSTPSNSVSETPLVPPPPSL